MQSSVKAYLNPRNLLWLMLALVLVRLLLAYFLPIADTTEARYGEIARKILERQDWIVLWHGDEDPFWGKPPLAFWLSAISMALFGVNEFAARLPAFILSLGTIALVMHFAAIQKRQLDYALTSGLVLFSSLLFFLFSATVMTDIALIFCITLSQISFWYAMTDKGRVWRYVFFAGLGFGLLAKGPLAVVLVGFPIFFWVLIRNQWLMLWKKLPWITGTLLAAFIAVPWYVMAEQQSPGFLNYFIIGEHFGRFLDAGWEGDRYGWAHETARGAIWGYFLLAILPWCLGLLRLSKSRQVLSQVLPKAKQHIQDDWLFYVFLWMLASLLFFTLSRNIILPYVLPALPPAALLLTEYLYSENEKFRRILVLLGSGLTLVLGVVLLVALTMPSTLSKFNTYKPVVQLLKTEDYNRLYIWQKRNFSAEFYTGNKVQYVADSTALQQLINQQQPFYLVVREKELAQLGQAREQLTSWLNLKVDGKAHVILTYKVN